MWAHVDYLPLAAVGGGRSAFGGQKLTPGGQGCGGSPTEERAENLVTCVRNLPGYSALVCDQAGHVPHNHVLHRFLRHRVTVDTCLCCQSKWLKCLKCLKVPAAVSPVAAHV